MMKFKPVGLGVKKLSDVIKTSPGRIDPRTGELVELKSYRPIAPWERDERPRRRSEDDDRPRYRGDDRSTPLYARGPRDDDRPRFRDEDRGRFRDEDRGRYRDNGDYSQRDDDRPRRDYGGVFRSSLSGPGQVTEFFGNAVPWVFLGIATIVALEASGVLNLSSKR